MIRKIQKFQTYGHQQVVRGGLFTGRRWGWCPQSLALLDAGLLDCHGHGDGADQGRSQENSPWELDSRCIDVDLLGSDRDHR